MKGTIFLQGHWTGQNFEEYPLRCFLLVSSQTKAFKPPKLGCIRNTSLSSFLSSTISKWLAIKVSYQKFPLPAASLCIHIHIQLTQKLSVLPQTLLCPFWSWWRLRGLMTGFSVCSPSEHMHCTSEKEQSPIPLRNVIWHPILLKNKTCSWGQASQTYVSICLVGVWNRAQVNAEYMLALTGGCSLWYCNTECSVHTQKIFLPP